MRELLRARRSLLVLVLVLSAAPAWAVKEWYDYYLEAREERIPRVR
jgi:hypothetical protein